jgi:cofilin
MVYSASNNVLKARLGVALEIQGNDEGDLEFANGEFYMPALPPLCFF